MLTVRDRAQEWGIDAEKISVIGFSAGGHLCGMLATSWHRPVLVPVFIVAAQNDGLVTAKNSLSLALQLQEHGISYELHMFELGDHGFGLGNNIYEPYRQDRAHASREWLPLAKTFLLHHIALETTEVEKNPFADQGDMLR